MTRWPWLAALLLLHAGCTSLTAGQQAHLDDWQRFATGSPPTGRQRHVSSATPGRGGGAMRSGGLMSVHTPVVGPLPAGQTRDFLLAHELAHWVLGHAYRRAPDEAATSLWDAQQERRELDANAEAVKILMVGRHWSERRAFFHAHAYLWSYRRGVEARRVGVPAGHPVRTCVEIHDLIRRYPAHRDISDSCPRAGAPVGRPRGARGDVEQPLDPR
jgi:hypothetical protein